jgi:two-component system response regulator NreC
VLILTMHEDGGLLQEALQAGASGYLIKRAAEADLIHAIQTVARGEIYVHGDMQQMLPRDAWPRPVAPKGAAQAALSEQEREVLHLVVKGYTNRQVADALHLEQVKVETLCNDLAKRLGVRGRVGLIQYAKEHQIL